MEFLLSGIFQKACDAEEQGFRARPPQQGKREALSEEGKWETILFKAERISQRLVKSFVATVSHDSHPLRFPIQSEFGRGTEDTRDFLVIELLQRAKTAAGMSERGDQG